MLQYIKQLEIRWADLDPNFHVLHSKYYDFGAFCRMSFFIEHGITPEALQQNHIGPIILREECVFRKEIRFGDHITINMAISKGYGDNRRWSFFHEIFKDGDTLAATISLDGAWMNTQTRRLAIPPASFGECFDNIPRTAGYLFIP